MVRITAFLVLSAGWLTAQQAHVNLEPNPQANTGNLLPFGANQISPEVHADRRVTFRLHAPAASSVALAPGPLLLALGQTTAPQSPVPFSREESGLWSVTVGPVPPGIYVYRFLLQGVAIPDPNNTFAGVSNQPPYSLLIVPGDSPALHDPLPVPHGTVTRHIYHSTVTQGERELYVYCPPGYSARKRYPVLYLLGGSGELAGNWAIEGRANFILDNLLAQKRALPMLIVMPNNQMVHRGGSDFRTRGAELLEQDLRRHIIPLVDSSYSTIRSPAGRALAGLSMGGGHTQAIGFRSLDLFSSFGIFSAGMRDSETVSAPFLTNPAAHKKVRLLFVGQGIWEARRLGPTGAATAALKATLEKYNVPFVYSEDAPGAHDWTTWRYLLGEKFLPALWR
jgi:enterochelin esterase family protein